MEIYVIQPISLGRSIPNITTASHLTRAMTNQMEQKLKA